MCTKRVSSHCKLTVKCQLIFFVVFLAIFPFKVNSQVLEAIGAVQNFMPVITQAASTAQLMVPGIKNVMGGLLEMDNHHSKCIQKSICSQFASEIIETREEFNPVKRSMVLIPKVIQERGKLRWIGDIIVNMFTGAIRRLGIDRTWRFYENRRQSGAPISLPIQIAQFAVSTIQKIPPERVIHVFDLIADATPFMNRDGAVYPFVRAGALGYAVGDKRTDDLENGVCEQVSKDCPSSYWEHLKVANEYEEPIGRVAQRVVTPSDGVKRVGKEGSAGATDLTRMEPRDLLNPRVFLCKTGRIVEDVVKKIMKKKDEKVEIKKEAYYNNHFAESCDEHDIEKYGITSDDDGSGSGEEEDCIAFSDGNAEVINDINSVPSKCKSNQTETEGSGDGNVDRRDDNDNEIPILVIEGLKKPSEGETDEHLVAEILKNSSSLSSIKVHRVLRLPMRDSSSNLPLVLVELDTVDHENAVIKGNSNRTRNEKIKMHKAEYKELWQYIEDLSAVKRIDNGDEVKSPEIIEEGEDDGSTSIADFRDRKKNSNNVATRTETNGESVATQESGNTRREKPPIVRARSSKILFFK